MRDAIYLLVIIILLILLIKKQQKRDHYWIRMAKNGKLEFPPRGDYRRIYGDAMILINQGIPVKEAMQTSLIKNKDATLRKLNRETTVLLRYLSLDERHEDLIVNMLSALTLFSNEELKELYDIFTDTQRYLPEDCKIQEQEDLKKFIDFYSSYYSEIQTPEVHISIYGKHDTWIDNIPINKNNANNKLGSYFWMIFKLILLCPGLFACNVLKTNKYKRELKELGVLVLYSYAIDKKRLYKLDPYKNIPARMYN